MLKVVFYHKMSEMKKSKKNLSYRVRRNCLPKFLITFSTTTNCSYQQFVFKMISLLRHTFQSKWSSKCLAFKCFSSYHILQPSKYSRLSSQENKLCTYFTQEKFCEFAILQKTCAKCSPSRAFLRNTVSQYTGPIKIFNNKE